MYPKQNNQYFMNNSMKVKIDFTARYTLCSDAFETRQWNICIRLKYVHKFLPTPAVINLLCLFFSNLVESNCELQQCCSRMRKPEMLLNKRFRKIDCLVLESIIVKFQLNQIYVCKQLTDQSSQINRFPTGYHTILRSFLCQTLTPASIFRINFIFTTCQH